MEPGNLVELLILIILIFLSSWCSSAETALTSVSRLRLRSLSDDGNQRAKLALDLLENHQTKMLSAILIANNVVNLSASALTSVIAARLGGNLAVTIGTAIITLVILIFGEVSPKTAATLESEKFSLKCVKVVKFLMVLLTPLIWLINVLSRGVLFLRHIDPSERNTQTTEEELRTMVEVSHEDGVIKNDEKEMINNVFDLTDSQAKDIMVPRVDVACVDVEMGRDEVLKLFSGEKFTRLPVYEENPDHIIGILNMKDLLLCDTTRPFRIKDYLRDAYYTHEFKNTYELFLEMRKATVTMSIVLDEYGIMVGIITMEDILEEIVGEIRDEYDQSELNEIRKVGPGDYIVEGSCSLNDINDAIGTDFESEDYDSIGGYLIGLLDHIPERGETAKDRFGNQIRAIEVDGNRIVKVRLGVAGRKKGQNSETESTDENADKDNKDNNDKNRNKSKNQDNDEDSDRDYVDGNDID
ncbi:MAG: hemolysin family protein [Lachnospiraceae bacterium]|nr:hemolysin family protein [Lachnospiraceae bacterium]